MHHVFQPFPIEDLDFNPFKKFREDGAALVIKDSANKRINATAINFGSVGNFFDKNVAVLYLDKKTYTSELMQVEDYVSINFFDMDIKGMRNSLKFLRKASGRDEDKIKALGMHIDADGDAPYLDEANFVIICRILACVESDDGKFFCDDAKNILTENPQVIFLTEIVNSFCR
ncbi:MAG: hypothetical protein K5851_03285 [Lachnospiraceae bacterium]|nr:hypothetical protein [Lachnospiraceae bacterium]